MIRVKVCGITNLEDALVSVTAGADALGFNFWPKSPRAIDPRRTAELVRNLPPFVTPVGVFVNEPPEKVKRLAERAGIRAVQLHGDESPDQVAALAGDGLAVFKAFRVSRGFRPQVLQKYAHADAFLLDASVEGERGGTGRTFDWSLAARANPYGRIVLAGGLKRENVLEAVRRARPYAVDVCTGVEKSPGLKDHARLRDFIRRVKGTAVG